MEKQNNEKDLPLLLVKIPGKKNFFFDSFFRYSPSCPKKIFFYTLCEKPFGKYS